MSVQFSSWWDFIHFSDSVRHDARFFHDQKVKNFLETLWGTSQNRHTALNEGAMVWRAQLGNRMVKRVDSSEELVLEYEEEAPFLESRMKPLPYSAHEGRANPRGMPCLYVGTDAETAMSEVRPWLGANVSIAQMQLKRNISLIDFSVGHSSAGQYFLEEPSPEIREQTIWSQVDKSFSEPVSNDMGSPDYVATQIISEFFRKKGFDGVAYKSKLGPGINLALFDLDVAELVSCEIRSTKTISYEFGPPMNGYHLKPVIANS